MTDAGERDTEQSPFLEDGRGSRLSDVLWKVADPSALRLALSCGGVVACLGVYGIQQEKIMALPYGEEFFICSLFLVFMNRVGAVLLAGICALYNGELLTPSAPMWKYAAVSFSNVGATTCQYESLKFVSFPVQMLGKSSKMLPVMGWGMALSSKKYAVSDWLVAAAVTGGCTVFLTSGEIGSLQHPNAPLFGLMLMVGFLACDGFTSTFQESIFRKHHCSTYNQMLFANLFSAGLAAGMLSASGGFRDSFAFAARHPDFVTDAALLTASGAVAQWFIYDVINEFDALTLAATMNARQLLSIVFSIKYYGHTCTALQVAGMAIAFGGLFYKSMTATPHRKSAR